jgi:nucleotide-binding universal stress UspA family protein
MYQTILVPLDGSLLAERALTYAHALAEAGGARGSLR